MIDSDLFLPQRLTDFIGQRRIVENLDVFIKAARRRHEVLEHVLLTGSPGLGKTTLANIIANEMGVELRSTAGQFVEKSGDFAALLTNLQEGDILFIDEIDRLNSAIKDVICPAMANYQLGLMVGQGTAARLINIDLPKFTLVGATTQLHKVKPHIRESFGITFNFIPYSEEELAQIICKSAGSLKLELSEGAAFIIARHAGGAPASANRLLRRVRDYADIEHEGRVTEQIAEEALNRLSIDT